IVVIAGWETADYVHLFGFPPANHAVHAFFFLSGFLLTMSLVKKPDALQFMIARLLRLTPAIVVSALVLALIVGPLVTGLPLADYFNVSELTSFMVSIVSLWDIQHGLPGVFETNPEPRDLYELLWTLRYEYLFCAGLIVAAWFGALRDRRLAAAGLALFSLAYVIFYAVPSVNDTLAPLHHAMRFTLPFALGTWAYLYRDRLPYSLPLGVALAVIAVASHGTGLAPFFSTVALGYFILLIGCSKSTWLKPTTWLGQFSYGVYIYGFPIQQLLIHLFPDSTPLENGIYTFLIAFPLAIVSWYAIEKPALAWRRPIVEAIRPLPTPSRGPVPVQSTPSQTRT
ncbi:MAG: acyltransferase, partial [Rhizobiales bacterium]|nr:acyltransferase [Hyphomicrobiales bacterium]